jgi:hypothetical protein
MASFDFFLKKRAVPCGKPNTHQNLFESVFILWQIVISIYQVLFIYSVNCMFIGASYQE